MAAARSLPHNLDAEASILGGILRDPALLGSVDALETDDFFDLRHRVVFDAIRNLTAASKPIDIVTIADQIERVGKTAATGGIGFLGELVLHVPTAENVAAYAKIVRGKTLVRKVAIGAADLVARAERWQEDPDELVAQARRDLDELERGASTLQGPGSGASPDADPLCPPLRDFLGDVEPDDDDAEDWILRDIIPRGEPVLWGGPMKSGKTWSALDLSICMALGRPWLDFENTLGEARVLGVFLEDGKRRLRKRLWELCRAHGVTPNDPTLRANLRLSREPLRLPDEGPAIARRLKAWGPQVIVIDNLTRVMVGDPNSTRDAAAFTKAWLRLGDELGASVVLLHHLGKQNPKEKRDPFDTLRGSSDFGAAARNLIVTLPIRVEGDPVAEIRMRGNLDLRRESFALGFKREEIAGRHVARLSDRGDVRELVKQIADQGKAAKAADKRAVLDAENRKALLCARDHGAVSKSKLAAILQCSPPTAARRLAALVDQGLLTEPGPTGSAITPAGLAALESRS